MSLYMSIMSFNNARLIFNIFGPKKLFKSHCTWLTSMAIIATFSLVGTFICKNRLYDKNF